MKNLLVIINLILILCSPVIIEAQVHPWEKYGFDPKVITLSKGKYQEFHDLKTIVEIGSVLYNTETKQIVGFIEEDTLKENGLKPHIVSRWVSPDPLAEEYTSWSPYNYAMNNPIKFIDPDGRFVDWYLNLEKGQVQHIEGSDNHFDKGFVHLASDNASVGDIEESLNSKGYNYTKDANIAGGFNVDTKEAYKGWTMMQIFSPENIGSILMLANSNFSLGSTGNSSRNFGEKLLKNSSSLTSKTSEASIQLSKSRFGHTFINHGEEATNFLTNRAKGSGMAQGQFLDNQKAAQFIIDNLDKTTKGAVSIPIPKNFPARVIMPDGSFKAASHIRLVPSGSGVKTAYPLIQ